MARESSRVSVIGTDVARLVDTIVVGYVCASYSFWLILPWKTLSASALAPSVWVVS